MAVHEARNQCQGKAYIFRVVIEDDHFEDGREAYHAFAPALKGCHTWGSTYQEALANIQEAVEIYIEDLLESGESLPVDDDHDVIVQPTLAVLVNV